MARTSNPLTLKTKESLNDSVGRKATPTAKVKGHPDPIILPAGSIPIRAFNKAHETTNDQQKAREILRGIEARKAKISGLDRGGCTFVTVARRARLREDEAIAQEVGAHH